MSTRCQVKIVGSDFEEGVAITLYHHCDGYPSNMVPLLASAYKPDWEHGRVGKASSHIIATDVNGFEPEEGHDLHWDIQWYYVISISSKGHLADIPKWQLAVYDVPYDARSIDEMRQVFNGKIQDAVPLADAMEVTEDEE